MESNNNDVDLDNGSDISSSNERVPIIDDDLPNSILTFEGNLRGEDIDLNTHNNFNDHRTICESLYSEDNEGSSDVNTDSDSDSDSLDIDRIYSNSSYTERREKSSQNQEQQFSPIEYLIGSLNNALNSLEYDKSLVIQSKMAGELNNTTNQVLKTIEDLQASLTEQIAKYERLSKEIIPEIEYNLRKATKNAKILTKYVKSTYPIEYSKGRSKVLENLTEDEEGLFR